jgi:methylase of polypeptide subunit release factors
MNIWDEKFYRKEEEYRKEIFRIPHKDLPRFVKLLRKIKAKRILDLGCGTGRHVIALAKKGFEVYGVDISKKALNLAKERLEAGVPHYIFDKKELKKFFANFEILDIYITRDKIQTPSPHYTMFAKFKGTS